MSRMTWVSRLILTTMVLAFVDETIRKAIPGNPVAVTGIKAGLLIVAGLILVPTETMTRGGTAGLVAAFIPWIIYQSTSSVISSCRVGSVGMAIGTQLLYGAPILYLIAGVYAGKRYELTRRLTAIFLVGFTVACVVAVLQECCREALPRVLSFRIYREGHSLASGFYCDSVFASPQTLGIVGLCSLVICGVSAGFSVGRTRVIAWGVLACAAATCIFLSRIRVAALLAVCSLAFAIGLIALKGSPGALRTLARRGIMLLAVVWCVVCLAAVDGNPFGRVVSVVKAERAYYADLLNPNMLYGRLIYSGLEIGNDRKSTAWFGHGAGMGGPLMGLAGQSDAEYKVYDTGLFLLYREFGIIGTALFLIPFLHTYYRMFVLFARSRTATPHAVVPIAISCAMCIWFSLKSYTILTTVLSAILWFGSLGLAIGYLSRERNSQRRSGLPHCHYDSYHILGLQGSRALASMPRVPPAGPLHQFT